MKKFDSMRFLVGDQAVLDRMAERHLHFEIFAKETADFLACWAKKLRSLPEGMKDGSTAAFAFWIRRANIDEMRKSYSELTENGDTRYTGKGMCLQFAPSNIPALFAYSLAAGLLAGNSIVMRLPSSLSPSQEAILRALNEALDEKKIWQDRLVLIQYDHDKEITDELSARCDVRVIWGGDQSIAEIQKSKISEFARDITFPNRRSMAVINAESVLNDPDPESTARLFYNDTYLNDQNACSSPSFIIWTGSEDAAQRASDLFFERLERFLSGKYEVQTEIAVRKYEQVLFLSAKKMADEIRMNGNAIVRIRCESPDPSLWDYMIPGGFFAEYMPDTGSQVFADEKSISMLTDVCQTISCFGHDLAEVENIIKKALPEKEFQVTAMGHTLDFALKWDGKDLIREMCRPDAEEYMLEREGCRLYVRKQGEGPLLLLIHGVASDSDYFTDTAGILEKYFTVISYDRRGYSRSVYSTGCEESKALVSVESQAEDAAAVLKKFMKEEGELPLIAGCSAGGLVALELAAKHPDLVSKIFLYETVYSVKEETLEGIEDWKKKLKDAAANNRLAYAMLLFINAIGPHDDMAPALPAGSIQRNMENLQRFLELELDDFLGYSKNHRNMHLDVPVICGAGSLDSDTMFYRMIHDAADFWHTDCNEFEGSHNLAQDRPETFAGWITDTVQNLDLI